jgi:hypothetical protein
MFKNRKKFTHPYSFALPPGVVVFLPHSTVPSIVPTSKLDGVR